MSDDSEQTDPAAVFACAHSLWQECERLTKSRERVNLSACYNGGDEFMRVIMRVATRFENWASDHIEFSEIDEVWPYMMEERFGATCVDVMGVENLADFNDDDCLRAALRLRLPVKFTDGLRVPVDVTATNTVPNSPFVALRIQTVRQRFEDNHVEPFTVIDEPFDAELSEPSFALYGVESDGTLEHIADRDTYAYAVQLARSLAPGIDFPDTPSTRVS